jgi:hypothetical protein
MKPVLLAIPVDDRPVTGEQVAGLVAAAGWELRLPPAPWLGRFRTPGDCDALAEWLRTSIDDTVVGIIVSLDMLLYGGLVASRHVVIDDATLARRFGVLQSLRDRWPRLRIAAFIATMRLSNNNIADEEKDYWAQYGEAIWRWSYASDHAAVTGSDNPELPALERAIPAAIRVDYLATRARNFTWMQAAIDATQAGVIDRLILPQDDTARYGFNIAERRRLEAEVTQRKLADRVRIYPGADEVLHTLAAHAIRSVAGAPRELIAEVLPSDPRCFDQLVARYEDRPVRLALAAQAEAVGIRLVPSDASHAADLVIAIHTQGDAQGDWAMRLPLPAWQPITSTWLDAIEAAIDEGRAVVVLDLAYANGGDPDLIAALASRGLLARLAAYAGWNTASNSIGSALAQVVMAWGRLDSRENRSNLALRLLEDYVYQAVVRQVVRLGYDFESRATRSSSLAAVVRGVFSAHARSFIAGQRLPVLLTDVWLPWDRTFEIGIRLQPNPDQPESCE